MTYTARTWLVIVVCALCALVVLLVFLQYRRARWQRKKPPAFAQSRAVSGTTCPMDCSEDGLPPVIDMCNGGDPCSNDHDWDGICLDYPGNEMQFCAANPDICQQRCEDSMKTNSCSSHPYCLENSLCLFPEAELPSGGSTVVNTASTIAVTNAGGDLARVFQRTDPSMPFHEVTVLQADAHHIGMNADGSVIFVGSAKELLLYHDVGVNVPQYAVLTKFTTSYTVGPMGLLDDGETVVVITYSAKLAVFSVNEQGAYQETQLDIPSKHNCLPNLLYASGKWAYAFDTQSSQAVRASKTTLQVLPSLGIQRDTSFKYPGICTGSEDGRWAAVIGTTSAGVINSVLSANTGYVYLWDTVGESMRARNVWQMRVERPVINGTFVGNHLALLRSQSFDIYQHQNATDFTPEMWVQFASIPHPDTNPVRARIDGRFLYVSTSQMTRVIDIGPDYLARYALPMPVDRPQPIPGERHYLKENATGKYLQLIRRGKCFRLSEYPTPWRLPVPGDLAPVRDGFGLGLCWTTYETGPVEEAAGVPEWGYMLADESDECTDISWTPSRDGLTYENTGLLVQPLAGDLDPLCIRLVWQGNNAYPWEQIQQASTLRRERVSLFLGGFYLGADLKLHSQQPFDGGWELFLSDDFRLTENEYRFTSPLRTRDAAYLQAAQSGDIRLVTRSPDATILEIDRNGDKLRFRDPETGLYLSIADNQVVFEAAHSDWSFEKYSPTLDALPDVLTPVVPAERATWLVCEIAVNEPGTVFDAPYTALGLDGQPVGLLTDWGDGTPLNREFLHTYQSTGDKYKFIVSINPEDMMTSILDRYNFMSGVLQMPVCPILSVVSIGGSRLQFFPNGPWTAPIESLHCISGSTAPLMSVEGWDVSGLKTLDNMFLGSAFNLPIRRWNTAHIVSMKSCFSGTTHFNSVFSFDFTNVTSLESMFENAKAFNQAINWATPKLRDFDGFLQSAAVFNSSVQLDTRQVTSMRYIFARTPLFNAAITFSTENVETMAQMFYSATSYNRRDDAMAWDLRTLCRTPIPGRLSDIFSNSGLSRDNLSDILQKWSPLLFRAVGKKEPIGIAGLQYGIMFYSNSFTLHSENSQYVGYHLQWDDKNKKRLTTGFPTTGSVQDPKGVVMRGGVVGHMLVNYWNSYAIGISGTGLNRNKYTGNSVDTIGTAGQHLMFNSRSNVSAILQYSNEGCIDVGKNDITRSKYSGAASQQWEIKYSYGAVDAYGYGKVALYNPSANVYLGFASDGKTTLASGSSSAPPSGDSFKIQLRPLYKQ